MNDENHVRFFGFVIFSLIIAAITAAYWYGAGVQARVYKRQGIEMSQWEVFMGAKPAERTINIKSIESPP